MVSAGSQCLQVQTRRFDFQKLAHSDQTRAHGSGLAYVQHGIHETAAWIVACVLNVAGLMLRQKRCKPVSQACVQLRWP